MKSKLLTILSILIAALGYARDISIDQKIPSLDSLVAIDENSRIPKDKAFLIENWATWCGPCVRSFTHISEVLPILESNGIESVAITNEKEKAVRKFLNKRPDIVPIPVFVDTENSVRGTLGIGAIPTTLLVRPDSTIYWRGHPRSLTPRLVELFAKSLEEPDGLIAGRIHRDMIIDTDLRLIGERESPLGLRDRKFIETLFTEEELQEYSYFAVFTWTKYPMGGRFDGSKSLDVVEDFIGKAPKGSIKVISITKGNNEERLEKYYEKNEHTFDRRNPPSDLYTRAIGLGNAYVFDNTGLVVWSGKSHYLSLSLMNYLESNRKTGEPEVSSNNAGHRSSVQSPP